MRKLFLALTLFVAASFALSAQIPDWASDKPIQDIRFDGLQRVSSTDLEGIIKPFIGKPLTEQIQDEIQRRLYEMGGFDSVLPGYEAANTAKSSVVVVYDVIERPVVDDIIIKGNASQRSTDLLAEILLKPGVPVVRPKVVQDEEKLRAYYIKNGYADVKIESSVDNGRKPNSRTVTFTISEGFRTSVRKISFSGQKFASESALKGLLKTAEQSLFNAGVFQEANLELDAQAILKYYRDNGYIDAKLLDIIRSSEFSDFDKRNYLSLTYYVEEGEQWTLGGLSVKGNEIFSTEKLQGLIRSKTGAVLNWSRLQADYQGIADLYYQNGYINNAITMDQEKNRDTRVLNATIRIEEKGRAYIENIIIRGAKKTDPAVILRTLPFETGDVFSSARIREGLLGLTNLRYFSDLSPETPAGSVPGLYDLVLNLTEQNTIDLRLGFSLTGTAEVPVAGFVRFADTNFLGKGVELGAELSISEKQQKITGNFYDPWLFGPHWGAGITLSVERAMKSDVAVDMLGPIFTGSEPNAVPDPFDGHYVFSADQSSGSYAGYKAGQAFPGIPSAAEIVQYGLVTDYAFAGGSAALDPAYTMDYVNWDISLGLNTGKKERTPLGWFGWAVSGNVELNYVDYDQDKFRPFSPVLRDNYQKFLFINTLGFKLSLDNRDITFDPGNGYYLSQGLSMVGGLLGGTRHYVQSSSNIQAYLTLWDIPIPLVDGWNWKQVLAFNSSLDVIWPQFFNWTADTGPGFMENQVASDRLLSTNPMMIARGWDPVGNGEALWNSWLELRYPILPQILSLDLFFDAVRIVPNREDIFDFSPGKASNGWLFGFGGGLRLLTPSLPLRLYLGKRFSVDPAGNVKFETGNMFADTTEGSGVDLIFAFSLMN